jgi:signal transduction histidine kinase
MNALIQEVIKLQNEFDKTLQLKARAIQKREYHKAVRERIREVALLDKAKIRLEELARFIESLPEADQQEYRDFLRQAKVFFRLNMQEQLTAIYQEKARLEDELEKLQQQKKQLLSEYKFQLANSVRERIAEVSEKLQQLENKINYIRQQALEN